MTALRKRLAIPSDRRMWDLFRAIDRGWPLEQIHELTKIDPWFLRQFAEIAEMRRAAAADGLDGLDAGRDAPAEAERIRRPGAGARAEDAGVGGARAPRWRRASSRSTSASIRAPPSSNRSRRISTARTSRPARRIRTRSPRSSSSAADPNRIGQGIEFDYCCCHAAFALREEGLETVMINCNPETVSTDYDTADRLYFQPLTFEDVMAVIETERSAGGDVSCLVQFGGQTPLKLSLALQKAGVRILGHVARFDRSRRRSEAVRRAPLEPATSPSRRAARRRRGKRRARSPRRSGSRSSSAPRMCSAGAAWRSSTTSARSIAT